MSRSVSVSLIGLAVVVWLTSMSLFTVNERQLAIKFQLGEVVRYDYTPGLYFKVPFFNNIRLFDSRIITLDAEAERYLTFEKKNVVVDSFVKWHITDVSKFYTTMGGDQRNANLRLGQLVRDGLRGEFGKRTIQEAISGERSEIMSVITSQIAVQSDDFGIEVVDVRIKRIELPAEVSSSVYSRMEAERARVAKDLRSRGAEAAERITADADRQRTVLLAEAYRDAERTRGEGDAVSADIYAKAFGKNEEFYAMYRSFNAYKNVFSSKDDMLLLDPKSEFFDYFKSQKGRGN